MTSSTWDPSLYDDNHSFVWENRTDLVDLLAPRPGERILDVGCGTGHLTARIAQAGAKVVGIDRARQNYPDLRFEQGDVRNLTYGQEFEAVFSNAVLHWVRPPEAAVEGIRQALKPGGRFVAELGGEGNIALILDAVDSARKELGVPGLTTTRSTFFFPSPDEYTSILESHGFSVTQADMFDSPTPLDWGREGHAALVGHVRWRTPGRSGGRPAVRGHQPGRSRTEATTLRG